MLVGGVVKVMKRRLPAGQRSLSFLLLSFLLLSFVLALGCSTSAPVILRPHIPVAEEGFLLDPVSGFPLSASPELEQRVRSAYAVLRDGGEIVGINAAMDEVLESDPGFHAARVVQAQLAFIAEDYQAVQELLLPIAGELPEYLACQILLGRAAELAENQEVAFRAYRSIQASSSIAGERVLELAPKVIEVSLEAFYEALDRGRLGEAEILLNELVAWAGGVGAPQEDLGPPDLRILEAQREVANGRGDLEAEMTVVQELVARDPYNETWEERLADLELETGDVRGALARYERLAETRADDVSLMEKVARAKFLWRLELLPDHVAGLRTRGELNRADFAVLLYWLVPEVRYATVDNPPIATDILDHPRHEEILRVMNLRLIEVDQTLHRFSPEKSMTRILALRALIGLMGISEKSFTCLPENERRSLASLGQGALCRKAASCGLIPETADCLPGAAISGDESLELFRQTLDLLGST